MITVDSTWMYFDIFKLHSSFLSSKLEKNPQWLLKFACKDSELGGGLWGRQRRLREKFVSRAGDRLDAGDLRFLGRFAGVSRAMREG